MQHNTFEHRMTVGRAACSTSGMTALVSCGRHGALAFFGLLVHFFSWVRS